MRENTKKSKTSAVQPENDASVQVHIGGDSTLHDTLCTGRYPEIVSEAIVGALVRNSAGSRVNFKLFCFTLLPPIHFLRLAGILHSAYAGKQMLLKGLILFLDMKESILDFAWCVVSLSSFC